jgi:hypothetical protein
MAPKRDPRSQNVKARIFWHLGWMGERDSQGDKLGEWAEPVDSITFKCKWCGKVKFQIF